MLNGLDLFTGIGGLTLALGGWVRPIAYCERDRYCHAVLLSRMQLGELPNAPIWDDITTLRKTMLPGHVDIVYGGFPCQDISAAGNGIGLGGGRSGLFQHIARLVQETNPHFVFLENVPAIRTRGLNGVIQTFTELGYDCRWTIVSAAEVGAPHLRKRWFLLAHSHSPKLRIESRRGSGASGRKEIESQFDSENMADAESDGRIKGWPQSERKQGGFDDAVSCGIMGHPGHPGHPRPQGPQEPKETWKALAEHRRSGIGEWPPGLPKPALHRGDHGLLARVDRLRGLGNAVVPLQAREAFMRLSGLIDYKRESEK